ncbi:hypothetical protein BGZ65_006911 [Modicella reniformis]|uniref:Uncharacterized protein n=1 Tax=Modicella reniformis TaxID=1440133 RepID=A0A9P6M7T4_9FUNG|nr:hypothetical protein BGZ65_006911 [Modicella reniformis]
MSKSDVEQNAKETANKVKVLEGDIRRKIVSGYLQLQESGQASADDPMIYQYLYEARQRLRAARIDLNPREVVEAELPRVLLLEPSVQGGNIRTQEQTCITVPGWEHPAVEEATEHLDISVLLRDQDQFIQSKGGRKQHQVAFGDLQDVNDCDAMTTSEPPPNIVNKEPLQSPSVLSTSQNPSGQSRANALASLKLPDAFTITAPQINEASSTRRMESRRRRRLRQDIHKDVQQALEDVSGRDQRVSAATTPEDVDKAQEGRRQSREILRTFESSKARRKDKGTQRLRTNKTLSRLAAARSRFYPVNCVPE